MSDKTIPTSPNNLLSPEQVDAVSGGDGSCTPAQWLGLTTQITAAYESLVDFTSHVIERLANSK